MRFFLYFILIALLVSFAHAQDFIVKSVCIVPNDASRPSDQIIEKFRSLIEDTQEFYKNEMKRYGYGSKTFRLDVDREGKPVVQIINGKYSKSQYMNDPQNYGKREFPVSDTIYIILISDINLFFGYFGTADVTLNETCAGCRGFAYIGERDGNFTFNTVAHELGHAFGLMHNLKGQQGDHSYLMWIGKDRLDEHEARWLNKSPYFNHDFTVKNPPRTTKIHRFEAINKGGTDYIKLKVDMIGHNSLYQAQAFRAIDHCVLAWDALNGHSDTAELIIPKPDLFIENKVFVQAIDSRGNQHLYSHKLTIPLDLEVTETNS